MPGCRERCFKGWERISADIPGCYAETAKPADLSPVMMPHPFLPSKLSRKSLAAGALAS